MDPAGCVDNGSSKAGTQGDGSESATKIRATVQLCAGSNSSGGVNATFRDFARDALRKTHARGPSPLDVHPSNMLNFVTGQSSVWADLRAVLDPVQMGSVEEMMRELGVDNSFVIREEVINFKKACLRVLHEEGPLETLLRQLTCFYFCDLVAFPDTSEPHQRFVRLCSVLERCRGARSALNDCRVVTKCIAQWPRHPDAPVPDRAVPTITSSLLVLELRRILSTARQFLDDNNRPAMVVDSQMAVRSKFPGHLSVDPRGSGWNPSLPALTPTWHRLLCSLEALRLPADVSEIIKSILIARGAYKALSIRDAATLFRDELDVLASDMQSTLSDMQAAISVMDASLDDGTTAKEAVENLQRITSCSGTVDGRKHIRGNIPGGRGVRDEMHRRRHASLMEGALPIIQDMSSCFTQILSSPGSRLFTAGDCTRHAVFVPPQFRAGPRFGKLRREVEEDTSSMRAEIASGPSIPSGRTRTGAEGPVTRWAGKAKCTRCRGKFGALWIKHGVCFACEEATRVEGRCPFRTQCSTKWWCPHARCCVLCDAWSCEECRLVRSGGEGVADLASMEGVSLICLDFDRTLCSTKAGGSPLVGNHSLDPELKALASWHGNVHIVTRNSHQEDILSFLNDAEMEVAGVHCVRKRASKADVILDLYPSDGSPKDIRVLFVDDDVVEHSNPRLQEARHVLRVLFTRGTV